VSYVREIKESKSIFLHGIASLYLGVDRILTTFRPGMHNVLVWKYILVTLGNLNPVIEREDGGGDKNEGKGRD
jgi:hypothetical protein